MQPVDKVTESFDIEAVMPSPAASATPPTRLTAQLPSKLGTSAGAAALA